MLQHVSHLFLSLQQIHTGYLMHVYNVFRRVGYVTTETISNQWDVLWSHEYPFALDELKEQLHELRPYQKVSFLFILLASFLCFFLTEHL